jgi:hypothetical protein
MPDQLKFTIADITTAVEWPADQFEFDTPKAYRPFLSENRTDLSLKLRTGSPTVASRRRVFDSPPIWSLYRNGSTAVIEIFAKDAGLQRYLVLAPDVQEAALHFSAQCDQFIDPFFGPTLELLMIHYLARERGVIIHACGIEYDGKGLLFAGESGAGKSTLAHLWNQETGASVLSDDRTLVREIDGELRMYGTPWHGEAIFGDPRGVKLDKIYFLGHGPFNSIQSLFTAETVLQLLQCSFPPHWDADGMKYTLEFFEQLARRVSCSELAFRPDESATEWVKREIFKSKK